MNNDSDEKRGQKMGLVTPPGSWLSLLGGNASTNVVDTQMLGIVTIEIVLAPANMLILGSTAT